MFQEFDYLIIGGGAAGFFSAIEIAYNTDSKKICILEAGSQLLSKVRISGGGRCNVTHNQFNPKLLTNNYPRGKNELLGPFTRFNPEHTCEWFKKHGVELKTEEDGRMFPTSDNSETIIDCLLNTAKKLQIKIWNHCKVLDIQKNDDLFEVKYRTQKTEETIRTAAIVICTGGSRTGHVLASELGHTIVDPYPSLFSFNIKDSRLKELQGLSFQNCELKILKNIKTTGPVLITHWGLSGPAVIRLSALAAKELADLKYNCELTINFFPEFSLDEVVEEINSYKNKFPNRRLEISNPLSLPKRYWASILKYLSLPTNLTWQEISKNEISQLAKQHSTAVFKISGKGEFKDEFVTAGGVDLKEIDFKAFESKICKNLYFAGEVLNIDGLTGGFNFQNAWTSAWHIGQAQSKF